MLIRQAKTLYADDSKFPDLDATVYALDSSTIDLCMTLFPWAHFRRMKSAVKMHTLLNLCGNIPEFILITEGNVYDVNVLDHIIPLPGAYHVMDRAYLDFERLYTILQILSVSVFEKTPLLQAFQGAAHSNEGGDICNQLSLWG